MIKRLRPQYSNDELAEVYTHPYDHTRWSDHIQRVAFTQQFIREVLAERDLTSVADLSCGDAAIPLGVGLQRHKVFLGDYVEREGYDYHGRIENTIISVPDVDLFILSETLEHIDDPVALLKLIRARADTLVLTTPLGEQDDGNPEHYWGWDRDGVESVLELAGWWPDRCVLFTPEVPEVYYTYQVWMATRDHP
jgi:hypothetical protein